jgi:serine/threonine-protein kinase
MLVAAVSTFLIAALSRCFRLVRRLGNGGMGTVFLAEQTAVGKRPVAVKVLSSKLLDDPDFLPRFRVEAGLPRHPVTASLPRHGGVKPPLRDYGSLHGPHSSLERRHHLRIRPVR